jgi:plasmid stabilization system protein ParE
MKYRVDLAPRAQRDLRRLYQTIDAANSKLAHQWFNGLENAILSLGEFPARCPTIPENPDLRHLLYGHKPYIYRIIYAIDHRARVVTVLHIRHGAQEPLT